MKLISREVVVDRGDWLYGVDTFEGGKTVPWSRLKPDALVGQRYEWRQTNYQPSEPFAWRLTPNNAAIV